MYLFSARRPSQSLDGTWQAIPDPYDWYEDNPFEDGGGVPLAADPDPPADYDLEDGYPLAVPGSWGEQLREFRYYEGTMWYARRFDADGSEGRQFLRIGAANYEAEVWLNGTRIGHHEGGFTPFSFEITDRLRPADNLLLVGVDNRRREDGIPETQTDWFNFGGITRSIEIVTVPETFVRNFKIESAIGEDVVTGTVHAWIDGDDPGTVRAAVPELDVETMLEPADEPDPAAPADAGDSLTRYAGEFEIARDAVTLWHPDHPRLYDVRIDCDGDAIEDRIGVRDLAVDGSDIVLNGEPVELRGISMHEEAAGKGRTLDDADVEQRFAWLNELGCNFARLAHYPHTRAMARKADEEGILLWEEVPAYWDVTFGEERVQALYRQQLRELLQRDWNRPSVALWSIANETDHEAEARNRVLPEMADFVRDLDETRLVTAACWVEATEAGLELLDPLADALDVVGVNEYFGWYTGEADAMASFVDQPAGPPIVISETGAGAKWGNHGAPDERWTEEFQAAYYRDTLAAIEESEQIVGLTPWILFDFMSPRRMNPHQRGYNRKGLLDEAGRKKQAFFVLQEQYREQR